MSTVNLFVKLCYNFITVTQDQYSYAAMTGLYLTSFLSPVHLIGASPEPFEGRYVLLLPAETSTAAI